MFYYFGPQQQQKQDEHLLQAIGFKVRGFLGGGRRWARCSQYSLAKKA